MEVFGTSHCGMVRKDNQDYFRYSLQEDGTLLTAVLCDGMGGENGGAVASKMAVDAFMSHASFSVDANCTVSDLKDILTEAVGYANERVYEKALSDILLEGMGCTLVAVASTPKHTIIANVGDSRAYLIREGTITQITKDHSYVAELLEKKQITPEQAAVHPKRNMITRAVGTEATVRCDFFEPKPAPGDRILLCSDGLSNLITPDEIMKSAKEERDVDEVCNVLISLAVSRGAPDNVTVLLISC